MDTMPASATTKNGTETTRTNRFQFETPDVRVSTSGPLVAILVPLKSNATKTLGEPRGEAFDYLIAERALALAVRLLRSAVMTEDPLDRHKEAREIAALMLGAADKLNLLDDAEVDA